MRIPTEIASSLALMAELMEIKGENEFKVRAIKVAAEILAAYRYDTETLLITIKSPGIPKIGQNLTTKIAELAVRGSCQELDSLLKEVPLSVLEIKAIPGLGPKKLKILWQDLGVSSIEELEKACQENKLIALKGFGEKLQIKIVEGIKQVKLYRGLTRQPRAFYLADLFINLIRNSFKSASVELTGEVRRKNEVISKIEILVAGPTLLDLNDLLLKAIETDSVQSDSVSKLILSTRRSEKIIFYLHDRKDLAKQNLILTGDLSFVSWAQEHLNLNAEVSSENELFSASKIEFVAPELREDLQKDSWGKLPEKDLIELAQIRGIIHCHSTYSDGIDPLKDMAVAAKQLGYGYLGIADHSISARYAGGLSVDRIEQQHAEIDRLNEELAPFRILKGIESDITTEGNLDYPEKILEKFDFIVASVHNGFQMSSEEMTARVVRALQNPYTSILGHPTGRILLEREAYEIDLEQIIKVAVKHAVLLEINASPYRLDLDWRWVKVAKELGAKFSIDPDSHRIAGFADLQYGVNVARKAGLMRNDVVNAHDLNSFMQSIKKII